MMYVKEALRVHKEDLLSDIYIGWSTGFLDFERKKLEELLLPKSVADLHGKTIHLGHPREISEQFAKLIEANADPSWFQ